MTRTIELPIDINCVSHWTINDALRELFQNAIDEGDYSVKITENGRLEIFNKGVLDIDTLILGKTSKTSKDIGGFGEGYKLAIVVLLRNDIDVKVITCSQTWRFSFEQSRTFSTKTLFVRIDDTMSERCSQNTYFVLNGIDHDKAEKIVKQYLLIYSEPFVRLRQIITSNAEILLNEEYSGKIFINNLYILSSDQFKYGYNFHPGVIHLDRDRRILESYELSKITSRLWSEISGNDEYDELIAKMVFDENIDVGEIGYSSLHSKTSNKINNIFESEHGELSAPYYFQSERENLSKNYRNINPTHTPLNITNVIEKSDNYKSKLENNKLKEEDKKTPYNLLSQIYLLVKPFLTHDLRSKFMDLINQSKEWRY